MSCPAPNEPAPGLGLPASPDKVDDRSPFALRASLEHLLRTRPLRISGYRVEDTIGEGGMGIVYRAIQESLGRPVALKVIRSDHAADQGFRKRFVREARLAGELNHPHVVACYDAGIDQDRHFLAMELIEGGDLRQLVATHGGQLPIALAVAVARDVASGLEAIHAAGIIHRDIKPANLLVGSDGRVKITDLGLARRLMDEGVLTSRGIAPGTPAFMAPEQARNAPDLDHRADLYALGATLYFLLTGSQPFAGASHYEVVAQILARSIPDPAALTANCPPGVSAIVRRAGALCPDDRYTNALEMRLDLERALSELPVPAWSAQTTTPAPAHADTVRDQPVRAATSAKPGTARFRTQAAAVLRKLRSAAMSMSSVTTPALADELAMLKTLSDDLRPLITGARSCGLTWFAAVAEATDRLVTKLHHWPQHLGPSPVRTLRQAIDALEQLNVADAQTLRDAGAHALVVDDDPISRKTMSLALTGVGITPLAVASAQEALILADQRSFSLVLSDVMMDGMNGFELTTRLRQLRAYRATPILLVTSLSDFGPSFRPSTEGATDAIIKPFLLVELGLKCLIHLIGVNERWVRLSASRKPEPTDPG